MKNLLVTAMLAAGCSSLLAFMVGCDWLATLFDADWVLLLVPFNFFVGCALAKWAGAKGRKAVAAWILTAVFGPFLLLEVGAWMNDSFDVSPPSRHDLLVLRAHCGRRNGCYVAVPSWRPNREEERLTIDFPEYMSLHDGAASRISFVTRQGRLGFEWLSEHHVYGSTRRSSGSDSRPRPDGYLGFAQADAVIDDVLRYLKSMFR
jgi:hypothetical protein